MGLPQPPHSPSCVPGRSLRLCVWYLSHLVSNASPFIPILQPQMQTEVGLRRLLPYVSAPTSLSQPAHLSLPEVCTRPPWARLTLGKADARQARARVSGETPEIAWGLVWPWRMPPLGVSDLDSWAEIELGLLYWLAPTLLPGTFLILLWGRRGPPVSTQVWAGFC